MRLDEYGEPRLLKKLSALARPGVRAAALPVGDDAGGVWIAGEAWLLKTDAFTAEAVRLAGMPEAALGWRAVTAVASDLLAKLARPVGFVLSLFVPGDAEVTRPVAWVRGAARASRAYGADFLGGDTNRGPEALAASGMGKAETAPLPRSARAGDWILLLGDRWGRSGAAIDAHYRGVSLGAFPEIAEAGYWPRARLALLALAPLRPFLSGSADSSDGLALTLWQLSEASGLRFVLDRLPQHPAVLRYAGRAGLAWEDLVLYGGEEFEAVVLVRPEGRGLVEGHLASLGIPYCFCGRVEDGPPGVRYRGRPLRRAGYLHFAPR